MNEYSEMCNINIFNRSTERGINLVERKNSLYYENYKKKQYSDVIIPFPFILQIISMNNERQNPPSLLTVYH